MFGNFGGVSPSLVISAPGYGTPGNGQHGRVYFVDSNTGRGLPDINLNLDSDADKILDGRVENGRFGTALAVVDLNKDGIDDLAISAPSTGLCVNFSNIELFPVWEKGLSYALKPKSEKKKHKKKTLRRQIVLNTRGVYCKMPTNIRG